MAIESNQNGNIAQSATGQQRRSSLSSPTVKPDRVHAQTVNGQHTDPHSIFEAPVRSTLSQARQASYQLPSPSPSPGSTSTAFELSDYAHGDVYVSGRSPLSQPVQQTATILNGVLPREQVPSPKQISKNLPSHDLHDIPEEKAKPRRASSSAKPLDEKALKLTPAEIEELMSAPESLPVASLARPRVQENGLLLSPHLGRSLSRTELAAPVNIPEGSKRNSNASSQARSPSFNEGSFDNSYSKSRPSHGSRTISTPVASRHDLSWSSGIRQPSPARRSLHTPSRLEPLDVTATAKSTKPRSASESDADIPPAAIPLPPTSIPTYLQLELASTRPSPLYIYRSSASEYPYESSRIKFERLLNFLLLPPQLEQVLLFGSLACLDAWLSTFTILPLRFCKACMILAQWWLQVLIRESRFITSFIWHGLGRMWHRKRERGRSFDSTSISRSPSRSSRPSISTNPSYLSSSRVHEITSSNGAAIDGAGEKLKELKVEIERQSRSRRNGRHRRTKSQPSALSSYHKADLLNGLLIVASSMVLMTFDASRMYHSIRGQSAMKLYVLYNLLEVLDRLLAALGQDILECLVSNETLDRGVDGRSKILRPFGMFILALIYNVLHAAALFYQVIALNVAVNSYSNALLTLLMSNQFVEIKSTVFKKFEKESLFQLTCADVVERFQLWLMLVIIGLRNVVEVGGLTVAAAPQAAAEAVRNTTIPLRSNSILPDSFTILPVWTGEVLSPFLIVLGSEMLVDWVKHAYISKFNSVKPAVYQKYLDVLAKDYYTNAFVNQNLIKRLGLPVIPLSCLFIRASVQTYHMFLATHLSLPLSSTATALSLDNVPESMPTAAAAALEHFDTIIRMALGRSTFGINLDGSARPWWSIGTDDIIASITFLLFFLVVYMVALICKLVLGMILLHFARNRYRSIKEREQLSVDTKGKRLGGWGMIEVDDEKKRIIYEADPEGLKAMKERERKQADKERAAGNKGVDFEKVTRYEMAGKRIW